MEQEEKESTCQQKCSGEVDSADTHRHSITVHKEAPSSIVHGAFSSA